MRALFRSRSSSENTLDLATAVFFLLSWPGFGEVTRQGVHHVVVSWKVFSVSVAHHMTPFPYSSALLGAVKRLLNNQCDLLVTEKDVDHSIGRCARYGEHERAGD